jgi:hypothetical protein
MSGRQTPKIVLRAGAAEMLRVFSVVRRRRSERGLAGFSLAIGLCGVVLAAAWLGHQRPGQSWINACCAEQDSYPLATWLTRLPGSLIAPARDLPVWGALVQIAAVLGIAEAAVGRRFTLVVAAAGHVVSTIVARVCVSLGPGHLLGVPTADGHVLDTGPSAATVALTAYLAVVLRCPILGSVAGVGLATASLTHSDLAGREHLVAWLVGMTCGGAHLLALHARADRATPQQAGGPAVSSEPAARFGPATPAGSPVATPGR